MAKKISLVKPEELSKFKLLEAKREKYIELARKRGLISSETDFFLERGVAFIEERIISPREMDFVPQFFTSEEAAKNYLELFYRDARHPIFLCRVIKKI